MGTCASLPVADGGAARGERAAAGPRRGAGAGASQPARGAPPPASPPPAGKPHRAGAPARLLWRTRQHDSARSLAGGGAAAPAAIHDALSGLLAAGGAPGAGAAAAAAAAALLPQGPDFGARGAYEVLDLLGSGGSGDTHLCREAAPGGGPGPAGGGGKGNGLVAVKWLARPLPRVAAPLLMREVDLQCRLGQGHPNIVCVNELLLTSSHLGLAQDYAAGGTLADAVMQRWETALQRGGLHLSEAEASFLFRQLGGAVAYCHEHRVAHRDIKLDNALMDGPLDDAPRVLLCDFGFARSWSGSGSGDMHTALGTPAYMSPQIISAKYSAQGFDGAAADVWAAGVTLFVMLFGCFPFDHARYTQPDRDEAHLEVRMQQEKLRWRSCRAAARALELGVLSPECADLLDRLLEKDETKRISMQQALEHPWIAAARADWSAAHEEAWAALQADAAARRAAMAQRTPAQLKRLRAAMLSMMAAATRSAADAPLHPIEAAGRGSADSSARGGGGSADSSNSGSAGAAARRARGAGSVPGIALLAAAEAARGKGARRASDSGGGESEARDTAAPRDAGGGAVPLEHGSSPGSDGDLGAPPSLLGAAASAFAAAAAGGADAFGAAAPGSPGCSPRGAARVAARRAGGGGTLPTVPSALSLSAALLDTSEHGGGAAAAAGAVAPWGVTDGRAAGGGLVWRLPLWAGAPDGALAIPLPHLRVIAAALVTQLQRGCASRRGAAAVMEPMQRKRSMQRMSWPLQPAAMAGGARRCGDEASAAACACEAPFAGMGM
ncbi:MAG: kinase-like domain-containing protein [Monoraphidium minutum]|nr:MAG: kinase-like domain-containing protein [Monoraphidium minutum]